MTTMADLPFSAQSLSPGDNQQGGSKRKRDDTDTQQRGKRNRYISIACNECKRRKIKCNGETPCQRCGNLKLECVYAPNCCNAHFKDSLEFRQMSDHLRALQDQVDHLYSALNSLRSSLSEDVPAHLDPSLYRQDNSPSISAPEAPMTVGLHRGSGAPKQPTFHGPTSSAFSFGVARSSLQTMGITGPDDAANSGMLSQEQTPSGSPRPATVPLHKNKDPIWALSKDEALRLCQVYEEEMGLMYPILNIDDIIAQVKMMFSFMDAAVRNGFMLKNAPGHDEMYDEDSGIIRLVLAIALITEGGGQSDMGVRLYDSVAVNAERRLLGRVDLDAIRLLTLMAMYHFHRDNEALSWRVIGVTARHCLELGLHRSETYSKVFQDDASAASAVKLFWSVYVLDRRWSLGTGMSFALQDADIDPALPKPDDSPYLTAMTAYAHIGSQVWKSTTSGESVAARNNQFSKDDVKYLDYQVIQWHRSIPETLRYIHPNSPEYAQASQHNPADPNAINEAGGKALYRLRVVLYLRANLMRILIYRPVLHSATSILSVSSRDCAQTVVDVAKDTIRVLTHVNQTSDIYQTQQMCFNYFLISALAVLFLAVSHAPAQFCESCREEFYMALELVRGLSAKSYVSKRLWRTIRGLKEIGPKLGLYATSVENGNTVAGLSDTQVQHLRKASQSQVHDAHSSAAMAMAGLAGHPIDENLFFASNQTSSNTGKDGNQQTWTSPNGMADELTNLFEAAGGFAGLMGTAGNAYAPAGDAGDLGDGVGTGSGIGMACGNEEELARIMRGLF